MPLPSALASTTVSATSTASETVSTDVRLEFVLVVEFDANVVFTGDVYDANCNVVDGLTTNQNPCTSGTFSCSPAPITITGYTNTFSKLRSAFWIYESKMKDSLF